MRFNFLKITMALAALAMIQGGSGGFAEERTGDDAEPIWNGRKAANEKEALAMLAAVDENEISAAAQAQKMPLDGPVKGFTREMREQHAENLRSTLKVAGGKSALPTDSDSVKEIKQDGTEKLKQLSRLNGKDFEKAYMDTMVKGHEDALSMIDHQLMPAVSSDAVRKHLLDTRKHVAMHLDEAKHVRDQI